MQGTIEGNTAANSYAANVVFTSGPFQNVDFINNILAANINGNMSSSFRVANIISSLSTQNVDFVSNNNAFYNKNNGVATYAVGYTGGYAGTPRLTLQDWQTATTKDSNSIYLAPFFENNNDLKLRSVAYNAPFDNNGIPLNQITKDALCIDREDAPDIGAYEFSSCNKINATELAGIQGQTISVTQNIDISTFINQNCEAFAIVNPQGYLPIEGNIHAQLTISDTIIKHNGRPLAKRYYDLRPVNKPNLATARVTLFFTQQDFDEYNNANGSYNEIASSPNDTVGLKNVRIIQFHKVSTDGTTYGYTGKMVEIDPSRTDIVWNNKLKAYEVSFNTYGFSGFYLSSAAPICRTSAIKYVATIPGNTYQWQVNTGSGFTNLADGGVYSGVNDDTLTLTNPLTSYYGYQYRCKVNGINDQVHDLYYMLKWEGDVSVSWGTSANWGCTSLPDEYTDVLIEADTPFKPQVNIPLAKARTLKVTKGADLQINTGRTLQVKK
jgi:hypothetical protein